MTLKTPFIYDRPVRGDEFVNREREVRGIFNDLYLGVSTVISGEPRIGKTSLLLRVADETIQRQYLETEVDQFVFVFINLNLVDREDYTPSMFWQEALSKLRTSGSDISELVEEAATADYSRRSLNRLFYHLGQQGRRLVLLLDEFEWLLVHPNFQEPMFFLHLRSFSASTGGLAIVLTSRLSLIQINQILRRLPRIHSPLLLYMSEESLGPFDDSAVGLLLERLTPESRIFIRRMAGRHPWMLQAMAVSVMEATDNDRLSALERFYERVAFHFEYLWDTLDEDTRTIALFLSLRELDRWAHCKLNVEVLEAVEISGEQLDKLAERGLAEQVGTSGNIRDIWRVGTQAFAWWVREMIIASKCPLHKQSSWFYYQQLLTQAQSDWLSRLVPNTPEWLEHGAESRAFLVALLKGEDR